MAEPPTTENATEPVGTAPEPSVTVTCAVKVTFAPVLAGFGVAVSATVVGCAPGAAAPADHVLPSADQVMKVLTVLVVAPAPLAPAKQRTTISWLPPGPMLPLSRMAAMLMPVASVPENAA